MWRGWVRYFSMSTWSSPKDANASRFAPAIPSASSAGLSTIRIPFPPPPAEALMRTG